MIDNRAVHEIVLYIENDATLYHRMYTPIVKNYARKKINGTYNQTLAVKGVVHLVNEGIYKYRKEIGEHEARDYGLGRGVSLETKVAAAKQILDGMREEIRDTAASIRNRGVKKKTARKKR